MRVFSALILFMLSINTFADVITPIGVTLTSGNKTTETPLTRVIDGSGLSDNSATTTLVSVTHDSTDANEARLFDNITSSIRLDLGASYDISDIYYWNTNTSGNNDVGTISYEFLNSGLVTVSSSGAVTIPGPLNLAQMPANQFTLPTIASGVQYVDVTFTARVGADSYAPGEIRLSGEPTVITPVVTDPTAVPIFNPLGLLVIISGLLFLGRRKLK